MCHQKTIYENRKYEIITYLLPTAFYGYPILLKQNQ